MSDNVAQRDTATSKPAPNQEGGASSCSPALREWLTAKVGMEDVPGTIRRLSRIVKFPKGEPEAEWRWFLEDLADRLERWTNESSV